MVFDPNRQQQQSRDNPTKQAAKQREEGTVCYTIQPVSLIFISFRQGSTQSANDKLIACCAHDPQIDKGCASKYCNFGNINQFMVLPFIAECGPKGNTISRIWDCISSKHDHTGCCTNQGVLPLCRAFCDASKAVPTDMLKYGLCTTEFDKYRLCFRTHLKHHNAIRQ